MIDALVATFWFAMVVLVSWAADIGHNLIDAERKLRKFEAKRG